MTITDDDAAPTLSVAVDNATIAEATGTSTLTVSTGATAFATDQTIDLELAGTATKDDDFTISSESLTLSAGATSVTATVTAVQDRIDEANETVLITASHNSSTIGSRQTVTITDDDDAPMLSSATVLSTGTNINLVFSESVAPSAALPPASAFTVTADGIAVPVDQISELSGALVVTLSPVFIRQGQVVVITYTDPTSGDDTNAIQDTTGNDAASFTTGSGGVPAVANDSTQNVPGAPTGLTATASGNTTINLSWTAPASTGSSAITGYKIEVSPDGITNWTDQVAHTNTATTTYAHTGLRPGTTRHYRVSAINSIGTSTTPSNVDSATTGTTDDCAGGTTTTCSVSPAEAPGSAVTGDLEVISDADWFRFSVTSGVVYEIEVEGAGGLVPKGTLPNPYLELRDATTVIASDDDSGPGLSSRLVWTADRTGTVYARIASSTASGTGTYTLTVTLTATIPATITDLAAAAGDGQVTLSWSVPGDGGAAITGFSYRQKTSGSYGDWIVISGAGRNDGPPHRHRPDERHGLHLPGAGGEQEGQRRRLQRGDGHAVQRPRAVDRGGSGLHRRGGRHLHGDRQHRHSLHRRPDHRPDPGRHGDRDQRLHPQRLLADADRRRDVRDDHGDRGAGHHRRVERDGHRLRRQRRHRHRHRRP